MTVHWAYYFTEVKPASSSVIWKARTHSERKYNLSYSHVQWTCFLGPPFHSISGVCRLLVGTRCCCFEWDYLHPVCSLEEFCVQNSRHSVPKTVNRGTIATPPLLPAFIIGCIIGCISWQYKLVSLRLRCTTELLHTCTDQKTLA